MSNLEKNKEFEKNVKLQKIKDTILGFSGALSIAGGIASGNPLLAIGGATAVFGSIVNPTIQKRREEWCENLLLDYYELTQNKKIDLESLLKNEKIIDAIIQASLIAIKTRYEEKRKLLRNGILNVSQGTSLEEDMQTMFFQWIDELTLTHIHLLLFFNEPSKWKEIDGKDWQTNFRGTFSINDYFTDKFPKLTGYEQYCRELHSKGLLHILHHEATHEENEMWRKPLLYSWTSELGKDFLKFIKES
ncbi:MAG: hypothetical protein ACW9W4_05665 [Candidatus Nitrosopumilus sp. bin_7KS]